jgi:hypothetical protein
MQTSMIFSISQTQSRKSTHLLGLCLHSCESCGQPGCLVFKVILLLYGATWVDFGFVTNRRREEGLECQVTQFVSYLVMMQDHQSAFLPTKSMPDIELLSAAITM